MNNVKSILVARAKTGATLNEIMEDYRELIGEDIKIYHLRHILKHINGVWNELDTFGTIKWHIESARSKHIIDMIKRQRDERILNKKKKNELYNNYYFKYDNFTQTPYVAQSLNARPNGYLNNFQLFGDDFFLWMSVHELKSRLLPGHRVLQTGFCISGQFIKDATRRVYTSPYIDTNVIINLGSVDILHGHEYLDIVSDFNELINAFKKRGIIPVVTTLPPLANLGHSHEMKHTLSMFNNYLRNSQEYVIDLHECLVNRNNKIMYECYQLEARYVTGSCQPHVLWNKLGRQRILKYIKKNIAYLYDFYNCN